ncbi:MAG: Bcr/CflA family multidrug efflux MFS transporter [Formivibrio sp.]|nr:Bcr/CflA family multidrug efflux MFS transporter [Formivibrio sp.]
MKKSDYRPVFFLLLGCLTAVGPLSIDMYLPSFPSIAAALATSDGAVQFTLAAFFIGLALGQAFYGPIADRFGRKPPLYGGLALYLLATVGCALSTNIEMLIFCRFIQALGGCAGMVVPRAIVRDHFEAQGAARAFSLLMLVMGIAPILAPILGGWILQFSSWHGIFWCMAVYGTFCLISIHFGLEESHPANPSQRLHPLTTLKSYGGLCKDRSFIGNVLAGGLAQSGMFTYIAGSPFVIIELWHIPAHHFGWVFGSNAFAYITASQVNAHLLRKYRIENILRRASWAPAGFGLVLLLSGTTGLGGLPLLLIGLFGYMMSLGFISPNTTANALAKQGHRAGLASALMGSLQFSLATLASTAIGLMHAKSALPMTGIMALCGVSSLILYRTLVAKPLGPLP